MLVIDNFLPQDKFLLLKNTMESYDFPWQFSDDINHPNEKKVFYKSQYIHMFDSIENRFKSIHCHLIEPIVNFLSPSKIIRIKSNSLPKTKKIIRCGWHIDSTANTLYSAIFYVNTNDGYTEFKDGVKINSIENRLAVFESNIIHSATTCTTDNRRIIINFVFHASDQTNVNINNYYANL